jgi:hypothetical protein
MEKIPPTLTVAIWSLRSLPITIVWGILFSLWQDPAIYWPDLTKLLGVALSNMLFGLLLEALVKELKKLKKWALRVAIGLSLLYIATIVFFLPGALSLWCLNNWETLAAFKPKNRLEKK